jgi:prolyl-tRNA editing enzyme YbaK/EbsC (Cys-tRNA(Pro) deacylase)
MKRKASPSTPKTPTPPLPARLKSYLGTLRFPHAAVGHKTVFTTYDLAQTLKAKLDRIAKTLLVKSDSGNLLVVLPGHRALDFGKLKKALKAKKVSLASEKDMVTKLKIKAGALTPFGGFHRLPVVLDRTLAKTKEMIAGTGHFGVSVKLTVRDFLKHEKPTVADIGKPSGQKLQVKAK